MKHFKMVNRFFVGETTFTEETAPDWLTSAKTVPGSTMDMRWFWEKVLKLEVGESINTDFQTITRIKPKPITTKGGW